MKQWFKQLWNGKPRAATAEERYQAAIQLAKDTPPEVLHDLILIIAMASPMSLVAILQDAGVAVATAPAQAPTVQSSEVVN